MASRILLCKVFVCCCFLLTTVCIGQEKGEDEKRESKKRSGYGKVDDGDSQSFVSEVEPGVKVFGVASRFAEVGICSSFDSSPDGGQLIFASGSKVKFFDLKENKVTDSIGEDRESYQYVRYSPDGRYVFAGGQGSGGSVVRVFDAIDKSSVGTITSKVEVAEKGGDEKAKALNHSSHFYLQHLFVSADATYVGMCSHDTLQVREVSSGDLVYHAKGLGYVQGACFSADEKHVIYPKNYQIEVAEIESGKKMKKADFAIVGQQSYGVMSNISSNSLAMAFGSAVSVFPMEGEAREPIVINLPSGHYAQSQAAFSDDGKMVVANSHVNQKMVLVVLDVEKKKVVKELQIASNSLLNCRFSGDNQALFVSGNGITGVKEVKLSGDAKLSKSKHPSGPSTVIAMHPDGKAFLSATQGGEVSWFDMETGDVDRSMQTANLAGIGFNESGANVLLASQWNIQEGVAEYSFKSGKRKKNYSVAAATPSGSVFSQIRRFMRGDEQTSHRQQYVLNARYSDDKTKIYSMAMTMEYVFESEGSGMFSQRYSSQQQKNSLSLFEFDLETGKRKTSKPIETKQFGFSEGEWVSSAAPSPRGDQFAVVRQKKLFLVSTESNKVVSEIELDEQTYIHSVRYSPDGRFLAVRGNGKLIIIDADSEEEVYVDPKNYGTSLFGFSRDSSRIVITSQNKNAPVEVIDTKSWQPVFTRKNTQNNRTSVALSKDGQKVLIGLNDTRIEAWDLAKISR